MAESCRYEIHVNTAKEEMVKEMRGLQERNDWVERILRALQSDSEGHGIIDALRKGESYKSIATRLKRGPLSDIAKESPTAERQLSEAFMDIEMNSSSDGTLGIELYLEEGRRWTYVTTDNGLVDHLLALYFTWLHPVHLILSEVHFMASYKNRSNLYCSLSLVNAICAMGCRFYESSPHPELDPSIDAKILGERFLAEARSHITADICNKMTTLQTFAIMFLMELSGGKGSRAASYLRLAADHLNKRLNDQHYTESTEIASWGLYTLNVYVSGRGMLLSSA